MRAKRTPTQRAASPAPCERLAWDTNFFGVETARARGDSLTAARTKSIDQWCWRNKIAFLYFLARADDPQTVRSAEKAGFALMDVRVTYEWKATGNIPAAAGIRPFKKSDLPALLKIAHASYTDSRFYHDTHLPRKKCDKLFETWTKITCEQHPDRVFVATAGDRSAGDAPPLGYVSCDFGDKPSWGRIPLIAVAKAARGKGVGERLINAAHHWAAAEKLTGITVVTQGRNIAAQRLYQRRGFLIRCLQLYYHKWYD